jgi:hypothetical protein
LIFFFIMMSIVDKGGNYGLKWERQTILAFYHFWHLLLSSFTIFTQGFLNNTNITIVDVDSGLIAILGQCQCASTQLLMSIV